MNRVTLREVAAARDIPDGFFDALIYINKVLGPALTSKATAPLDPQEIIVLANSIKQKGVFTHDNQD